LSDETRLLDWLAGGDGPAALEKPGEPRAQSSATDGALDPADLDQLAAETGYAVALGWSDSAATGRFDAAFVPRETAAETRPATLLPLVRAAHGEARPWSAYANRPLQAKLTRRLAPLLRAHLAERLPEAMVPSHVLVLDRLPLGANGKLDRAALPAPGGVREPGDAYVAPRDEVEQRLAALWQEVLRLDRLSVHADFFALGGHSLLATQLVSRVRDAFQVELPLRALFDAPTIAGLRAAVDALVAQGAVAGPAIVPLPRAGRRRAAVQGVAAGGR